MRPNQPPGSIWYISKYLATPSPSRTEGGRGYELMRELAAQGYQVLILVSDSNHLEGVPEFTGRHLLERLEGLQICWVRTMKFAGARSKRRILSWVHFEWQMLRLPRRQFNRPDVIVASSLSLLSVLTGVYLRQRYRARLVFEVRDIWPLTLTEEGGYSRFNPLVAALACVERFGYRHADAIVGTMPKLGAHVENVLGRPRTTFCIPMGFSMSTLEDPQPLPDGYREKFVPSDRFVVGYAGTIGGTNALDTLFDAAARLEGEQIHFLVAGDGDLRQHYLDLHGHLANVTFADKVPKQCVQAVLSCCDVLYMAAHPSRVWEYGQSLNKLIDYMLAGKPVVASYTGYPSMLNESASGTFIPAGNVDALVNELRRLAALDPSELASQGARGREWILRRRDYSQLARDYETILFPPDADALALT